LKDDTHGGQLGQTHQYCRCHCQHHVPLH
jgi:hypothetical protein